MAGAVAAGAHHTAYSSQLKTGHIEIFCKMADVERGVIDAQTELRRFKQQAPQMSQEGRRRFLKNEIPALQVTAASL